MKIALLSILLFAVFLGVQGTAITVYNYCGNSFSLYESDNDGGSFPVCSLTANGGRCDLNYGAKSFNLKAGGGGLTLAEFTIDSGGTDFYDVSRIVGYDVSIVIEPPNTDSCAYGVCTSPDCGPPGAYAKPGDNSATHACGTGGTFQVYFCAK